VLTKLMGLSITEAAMRAGISAGAMKVRVHRATRAAIRVMEADRE
jgi:DNA-directed RNA polymerase specialized sigma24 family protein